MIGIRQIQIDTPAKFGAPKYKAKHFEAVELFNEYITSPDYNNR